MNFADLGLGDDVLRAVADAGYTEPTPIQAQAIPVVLMGRDVLGCAQTGTGKTAGFTLPMIEILGAGKAKARMPRSLILEPTRELAAQVAESFETYGKYHKLNKALLIGGHTMNQQIKTIDKGVDVLIATPGRLLDLFDRGHLLMHDVKILVIDEADRMLDMGFIPDVEKIVSMLPSIRNTLFFSATMPPEIRRLADKFLMNPKEISVDPPSTTAETITQAMVMVKHGDGNRPGGGQKEKREILRQLIRKEKPNNALIFCNRKRDVDVVYKSLTRHGLEAFRLHGDMAQPVRTETLGKFKTGDIKLLVCSDVAARGLDIPDMSHVFNFDVPIHAEDYVHRIGRTGRAGKKGHTFMLATPEDGKYLSAIEKLIGNKIPVVTLDGQAKAGLATPASSTPSAPPSPAATDDKPRARQRGRGGRDRSRSENPRGKPPKPQQSSPPPSQAKPNVEKPQTKPETQAQKAPESTKGLGEHMPAFLKPVPPKGD
ncbi:MAG: DEAD/DEAH box helicase [Proteobacteria bacterium]|nr:DEAD/DEAH box helicase [Pseudomonadota bacterium]MDA1022716.1 DEAD/DEAH box helicase [Pseudomonadota bacterium]